MAQIPENVSIPLRDDQSEGLDKFIASEARRGLTLSKADAISLILTDRLDEEGLLDINLA
jgi:hypothetical protein